MKRMIPVTVRDRIATKTGDEEYICGNSDFTILFDFDAEWDAWPTKTARFSWAGNYHDVLFEGSECPVPVISDVFHFKVGVYAGNLRTTTAARVPAKKSVLCGGGIQHEPPAADVYNEILEKVNRRPTQEQMEKAIDQAMDAEFFIIHVENNVSDKSDEEIRAAADEGKVCVAAVKPFGWLFTYVGDRPSSDDSSVYCPTFTLVWYKEYGKMTALDLEVHGNAVKVRGRDNVNLPNPYKLTLTGAVSAEYDGSEQVTVKIPTIAGPAGKDGYTPKKGVDYFDGKDGKDGYTPQKGIDYFDGKDGPIGPAGADGFNPEVRLERTEDGVKITAVNKAGEESQTVYDGKDGADTEFFIVRIDSDNVSDHTEEEIQAAVGEGKICIAIEHTGEIYTYVGRMRKTNSESGYAETFYMPMKHAGAKADVIWIQVSGNQAAKFLRNDARLANPWKLTLTGAVEAEYDGSKQTTVKIPTIAGPAGKDGYTPQKGVDYFDGKDGKDGATGPAGADGYSPTITLTRITGGVRIDAQNKSGTQTATVYDGKDGEGGTGGGGGLPTGGDPNMMLVTDADGNAQWQERTHWKEEGLIDVLPEMTLEGTEGQFSILEPFAGEIIVGNTYTVTYNGTEYTCTAFPLQEGEGAPIMPSVGNQAAIGGEDTGEPFIIAYVPPEVVEMVGAYGIVMDMTGAASATVKIQYDGVVYHKLPNEYLDLPLVGSAVDVLPEMTLEGEEGDLPILTPFASEIVVGKTYTVTYNGTDYTCTAFPIQEAEDAPIMPSVGNQAAIGGEDTGEPFVIAYVPPDMFEMVGAYGIVMDMTGASSATVKIQVGSGVKIAAEALDLDWIPKLENVGETIFKTNVDEYILSPLDMTLVDKVAVGDKVIVICDGVFYELTAYEFEGYLCIGDQGLLVGGVDAEYTTEPFVIVELDGQTNIKHAVVGAETHTIELYKAGDSQKVAKEKLPSVFLPDMSALHVVITQNDDDTYSSSHNVSDIYKAYLENRPVFCSYDGAGNGISIKVFSLVQIGSYTAVFSRFDRGEEQMFTLRSIDGFRVDYEIVKYTKAT